MNLLRPRLSTLRPALKPSVACRYATTTAPFVPPASMRDMEHRPSRDRDNGREPQQKPLPPTATFYTARASYYDQVVALETSIQYARSALRTLQLIPLPAFARASLPPLTYTWKVKTAMETDMGCSLTMTRYRRLLGMLNELNRYRRIAQTAGCTELDGKMVAILEMYMKRGDGDVKKRNPVKFDEHGRTYTVGRRKTSHARVWIIPAKQVVVAPTEAPSIEEELGLAQPRANKLAVNPSTVLVNNMPLASYFTLPVDREKVIRPLKLAGVLGGYNVFTLVRGGGTTGQSGAVAHGIAKGLAAHEPTIADILKRAKLIRRDPRMVERKKTGLAKARKRYTWVKR
ncbi:SSU ribosomal protein S9P [Athelia psychrophila]|uniref:SSU ribosomal protein S9P n=1 Tax=Athelia psychrophila TaxID=1759441 RepID=A0A166WXU5_9AGAM|nr:SSU ribosomal protein S9P [Fibularhizoctonia sp. CBS 109695]